MDFSLFRKRNLNNYVFFCLFCAAVGCRGIFRQTLNTKKRFSFCFVLAYSYLCMNF